jgi:hypothetical protein
VIRALAPTLLALLALPGERVDGPPAAGTEVRRSWRIEETQRLEDLRVLRDGEREEGVSLPDVRAVRRLELVTRDHTAAVQHGRAVRVERSFERARLHEGPADGEPAATALEGRGVLFRWSRAEDRYERAFLDGRPPEPLLEELSTPRSLAALLPPPGTEPGATWEIPPADCAELLWPTGAPLLGDDPARTAGLRASLTGTARGRLGEPGADGALLVLLELELTAEHATEPVEAPGYSEVVVDTLRWELEGSLRWMTGEPHARGLELQGELAARSVTEARMGNAPTEDDPEPADTVVRTESDLVGPVRTVLTVERLSPR